MQIYRRIFIGIGFTWSVLFATACRDETVRKSEEAAEAAGQDIKAGAKKAVEKTKEGAEKAVEKTKEAGREIGEEVGPTLERAGDKLKEEGAELRQKVTTETSPSADAGPRPRK